MNFTAHISSEVLIACFRKSFELTEGKKARNEKIILLGVKIGHHTLMHRTLRHKNGITVAPCLN